VFAAFFGEINMNI